MSHNVETMFYTREKPWHGLGVRVDEALTSHEALVKAGLDWSVYQQQIMTAAGDVIDGYMANTRSKDSKVLGIVSPRYQVVQNVEAFAFVDALLSEGVKYETAGSLQEGRRTWMLAKLPGQFKAAEDTVESYLVFMNTHDGTGGIKVAITPIRVVCQNTLNLALSTTKRSWSTIHIGDLSEKLCEARKTLLMSSEYISAFQHEAEVLSRTKISDKKVIEFVQQLIPMPDEATSLQRTNTNRLREDMIIRYNEAPDLVVIPKSSWRFINAVSDFATHAKPLRKTATFQENLFSRTVEGNPIIDRAYELVKTLA